MLLRVVLPEKVTSKLSYFSCSSFPWMEASRAVARRPIKPNSVVALNSLGVFVCIRILAFPKAAVRPVI